MGENSHTPLAKIAKTFHKPLPNLFSIHPSTPIPSYSFSFFPILILSYRFLPPR